MILERQGDGFTFLHLDGLGLGIEDETGRSLCLGHDHALSGLQAGDPDLAVLICPKNAIAVAYYRSVRIDDLEARWAWTV